MILHTEDSIFLNYIEQYPYFFIFMASFNSSNQLDLALYDQEQTFSSYRVSHLDDNTFAFDLSGTFANNETVPDEYFTNDVYLDVRANSENGGYDRIYASPYISYYLDDTKSVKSVVNQYNLDFNSNGGTGSMDPIQVGGYYQLPTNSFTAPSKKEFFGWQVGDDPVIRFEKEKVLIFSDKTVKAIWHDLPTPTTTVSDSQIEVGQVTKITPTENSTKSSLGGSVENLISAADKAAGAAVWMEVNPIQNTSDDYTRMERGFALEHSGDLMECMEINIFKKVKGQEAEKVSETLDKATISFDLSDKPALMELAFNNQLFVYSIHNGKVSDLIVGTYNPTTHIYTFQADEFSVFGFFKQGNPNPNQSEGSGSGSGTNTIGYRFTNTGIK